MCKLLLKLGFMPCKLITECSLALHALVTHWHQSEECVWFSAPWGTLVHPVSLVLLQGLPVAYRLTCTLGQKALWSVGVSGFYFVNMGVLPESLMLFWQWLLLSSWRFWCWLSWYFTKSDRFGSADVRRLIERTLTGWRDEIRMFTNQLDRNWKSFIIWIIANEMQLRYFVRQVLNDPFLSSSSSVN